jgi:hypothetical protein
MDMHVTEGDLGKALQEAAMLAHVRISVWDSTKIDRAVMEQVKIHHNAKGNVGRLQKNTLAGVDGPLRAVRSAYAAVRVRHYQLTLPWASDAGAERQTGARLLCHPLLPRYLTELGQLERLAQNALDEFIPAYPGMVKEAAQNLGSMYNALDYPTADEIRMRFRIHRDFEPIPDGTGFKGLPSGMLDRLSRHLAARQRVQLEQANEAMWTEARERIAHLIDRLQEEDTKFKEATVTAVRELTGLLPGWNLGKDGRVDEIARDIEMMLAGVEAADLRKDAAIRTNVVHDAMKIAEKIEGWSLT